jgi:hypothetical protein
MNTLSRTGIMFATDSAGTFPTVAALDSSEYVFRYSVDLPESMNAWHVIANDPHCMMYSDEDWQCMDETNHDALISELSAVPVELSRDDLSDSPSMLEALETGLAIAGQYLIIAPTMVDDLDAMARCEKSLSDYPILDDDAYSTREWEAWAEYAPEAFKDEIRDGECAEMIDEDLSDFLTDHAETLLDELSQHLQYEYGFSGDYGPKFLTIFADLGGRHHFESKWFHEALKAAGQLTFPPTR